MAEYVCDGCAACCQDWPVLVSHEDAAREPLIAQRGRRLPVHLATLDWQYQLNPEAHGPACCFLDEHRRCEIYATRPTVCRGFAAGSERCRQARANHGLPALTATV